MWPAWEKRFQRCQAVATSVNVISQNPGKGRAWPFRLCARLQVPAVTPQVCSLSSADGLLLQAGRCPWNTTSCHGASVGVDHLVPERFPETLSPGTEVYKLSRGRSPGKMYLLSSPWSTPIKLFAFPFFRALFSPLKNFVVMGMVGMNGRLSLSQFPKNILRDTESWIHRDRNHQASQAVPLF